MKAFAYLRVSGASQVEGDGFDRQIAAIEKYAASSGIEIVRIFREEGVSGTKDLENRPALIALLEALEENGTKIVCIEKLDRLARDLMVQETIIADLRKRGFELISATEPDMMQNDPTRILMRQMLGAIAQYEKSMIVARLRVARMRVKTRSGRCEGQKPYGFYPGEADTLARIKALAGTGTSAKRIAETLNAGGIKPRTGERWHPYTVSRILRAV